MSEYIVKGAEPNETVLHTRTPNGYEEWRWLPVREEIVRCRDCKYCREHNMRAYGGGRDQLLCHHFSMSSGAGWPVESNGFCAWGERRDAWGDGHPDRSCEGCDIRDECHNDVERMRKDGMLRFSRCLFELRIEERMRELGIEVDE